MFLFISEVIFWIQHSSDTSCIETVPFIPAQDVLGLSSNLLWFCVKHPFSSTQKPNTWNQLNIDPWKLTWNLKILQLNRKLIFRTSILGFHVSFRACNQAPFPSRSRVNPFKAAVFCSLRAKLHTSTSFLAKTKEKRRPPAVFRQRSTQPSAFGQSCCYKYTWEVEILAFISISEVRHENCKTPLVHQRNTWDDENPVMFLAWFSSDSKGIRSD